MSILLLRRTSCCPLQRIVGYCDAPPKKKTLRRKKKHQKDDIVTSLPRDNHPGGVDFTKERLQKRVDFLQKLGIEASDAGSLSLQFPALFDINTSNFRLVVKTLQEHQLPVQRLLFKHPHIGGLYGKQVSACLNILTSVFSASEVEELIMENPLLLTYILNDNTMSKIKKLSGREKHTILSSLDMHLEKLCVADEEEGIELHEPIVLQEVVEDEDIALSDTPSDGEEFFKDYDKNFYTSFLVDLDELHQKCPDLFRCPKQRLEKCVETLLMAPFWFEVNEVEQFVKEHPHIFLKLSTKSFAQQMDYLDRSLKSYQNFYHIMKEGPVLFEDPRSFFSRLNLFKRFGFLDEDIGLILGPGNGWKCFQDNEEYNDACVERLLNLYLKEGGRTPSTSGDGEGSGGTSLNLTRAQVILSCPFCLSSKAEAKARPRLKYLRSLNKVNLIQDVRPHSSNPQGRDPQGGEPQGGEPQGGEPQGATSTLRKLLFARVDGFLDAVGAPDREEYKEKYMDEEKRVIQN